jgi:hypothetical protein
MQCKDIPDRPILEFLAKLSREEIESQYETEGGTVTWRPTTGCIWSGPAHSVGNGMPEAARDQDNLLLAKMRSLLKRGLVDGCCCGCRGDFELTAKGRAALGDEGA